MYSSQGFLKALDKVHTKGNMKATPRMMVKA
jgi:hypothetical protein